MYIFWVIRSHLPLYIRRLLITQKMYVYSYPLFSFFWWQQVWLHQSSWEVLCCFNLLLQKMAFQLIASHGSYTILGKVKVQVEYVYRQNVMKKICCRVARRTKASGNSILVLVFSLQHLGAAALLFPALWDRHIKIPISQASGFGTETLLFFFPRRRAQVTLCKVAVSGQRIFVPEDQPPRLFRRDPFKL